MKNESLQNPQGLRGRPVLLRHLLMFLLAFLVSSVANAQTTVSGKVSDERGTGMPGVNIIVKNTTNGTTSDGDGNYSLNVSGSDVTLVFSFIGYSTQEMVVGGRTTIDITMEPSVESLNEVVVVGYGVQRKVDVTGSVASVPIENLQMAPNTNVAQLLQGTVPGLNVGVANTSGGTPPIQIRARSTISGKQDVLIILDGIQYVGSLSSINPDDIASMYSKTPVQLLSTGLRPRTALF
jgi:TonB-dependent starch-binding outer membrane protein SusC